MASKKCPKCGEDNPAEAVMCWACYTPLSGAAAGGSVAAATMGAKPLGAGVVGGPSIAREEPKKKEIDPKMIGVVAFLLVGGVVAFLVNGGMGNGSSDDTSTTGDPTATPGGGFQSRSPDNGNTGFAPPPPNGNNNSAPPPPVALPFQTVTPPNPQFATGTVGILIDANKVNQAAGFARFAKDQLSRNGKWQNMQVCVFSDRQTADAFSQYQNKRRGAPLTNQEYSELATRGVWSTTPIFYESKGKSERIYYPSKSPYGWWSRR